MAKVAGDAIDHFLRQAGLTHPTGANKGEQPRRPPGEPLEHQLHLDLPAEERRQIRMGKGGGHGHTAAPSHRTARCGTILAAGSLASDLMRRRAVCEQATRRVVTPASSFSASPVELACSCAVRRSASGAVTAEVTV